VSVHTLRADLLRRACSVGDPREPEHDHTACQDDLEAVVAENLVRILDGATASAEGAISTSDGVAPVIDILVARNHIIDALKAAAVEVQQTRTERAAAALDRWEAMKADARARRDAGAPLPMAGAIGRAVNAAQGGVTPPQVATPWRPPQPGDEVYMGGQYVGTVPPKTDDLSDDERRMLDAVDRNEVLYNVIRSEVSGAVPALVTKPRAAFFDLVKRGLVDKGRSVVASGGDWYYAALTNAGREALGRES
jgi:hypothetical protein